MTISKIDLNPRVMCPEDNRKDVRPCRVTQSFIHAMISDLFRKFGVEVLDRMSFKNCNDSIKSVIATVADYMQAAEL